MENEIKDKWNEIITYMRDTYNINGVLFRTWINPLTIVSCDNDTIILAIDEKEQGDILGLIEKKYKVAFQVSIEVITNHQLDVRFIYQNEMDAKGVSSYNKEEMLEEKYPFLKQGHSFDTFVVSNSNNIAYNAAVAVAENPNGQLYNPLFLYGGVGLGKTHLMHAIGHSIMKEQNDAKVVYVSSEKFTNELINSIKSDKNEEFRNKYRNVDILLIDDIQFIAGKEGTQEEFFHTFNALHEANKQIIISSDRPPKEIPTLEDRLRSRFEMGLIADIQPPDFETRIAILKTKAQIENIDIPNEVMNYIATYIKSNIRELEGALTRVVAYSSLINKDISYDLAVEALKDIVTTSESQEISVNRIKEKVSTTFGIKMDDFNSKKRTRAIAYPRQIAMYLSRELTDLSLPKIGNEFGGRDHTTVIHAHDKISKDLELEKNSELKEKIDKIIVELKG